MPLTGHCYCGDISFEIRGEPVKIPQCYCESCRRATGGVMVVAAGYTKDQIKFGKIMPKTVAINDAVTRAFCGRCGAPISYKRNAAEYTFIYAGLFDDPEKIAPDVHCMLAEKVSWLPIIENLPKSDKLT